MDPQHLSRLQEEQAKAVSGTDQQISQIEKFKSDYKALQERLRTLPEKLTHDVMVPFGKLAFMPGKLVHTNEILVLLGDNWFAERTAKQAEDIASRRINELNKQMKDLKAQRKLLEPRLQFTSNLQGNFEGQKDVKEIVEEYDEEKERLWDDQHRKNVRKQREELRQTSKNLKLEKDKKTKTDGGQQSDEDLWARLNALEQEEAERGELESEESDEACNEDVKKNHGKTVTWHDETARLSVSRQSEEVNDDDAYDEDSDDDEDDHAGDNTENEDNNDGDGDSEEADDQESQLGRPVVRTIRFTHTDTPAHQVERTNPTGDASIKSPADIYKLYSPASILKKARHKREKPESSALRAGTDSSLSDEDETPPSVRLTASRSSSLKAFTGKVLEKPKEPSSGGDSVPPIAQVTPQEPVVKDEPPKRVSKFKASRLANPSFS